MIDLDRLQELKDFILDEESEGSLSQEQKCNICDFPEKDSPDCTVKDFCERYTPLSYNEQTVTLLKDLFETIDMLVGGLCRGEKCDCECNKVSKPHIIDNHVIDLILDFINQVEAKYPNLKIKWHYNNSEDVYYMIHDSLDLEFHSLDFAEFIGDLIGSMFYDKKIFNVTFYGEFEQCEEEEEELGAYEV